MHEPIDRAMGMKTIAELVENQVTLDRRTDIGVYYAQGYGIVKPATIKNLSGGNVKPFRKPA